MTTGFARGWQSDRENDGNTAGTNRDGSNVEAIAKAASSKWKRHRQETCPTRTILLASFNLSPVRRVQESWSPRRKSGPRKPLVRSDAGPSVSIEQEVSRWRISLRVFSLTEGPFSLEAVFARLRSSSVRATTAGKPLAADFYRLTAHFRPSTQTASSPVPTS